MKTYDFKRKLNVFLLLGFLLIFGISCNNKTGSNSTSDNNSDTPTSGKLKIAVDETFQRIAKSEVDVFQGIYANSEINIKNCSEVDAINLLLKDSIRLIIVSRKLNQKEKDSYFSKKEYYPDEVKIATDGIAIIVNNSNKDTLLSLDNLKNILIGKITNWKQINPTTKLGNIIVVFDNPNSSTVRQVIDSVNNGEKLSSNVTACNNNEEVINYVSRTSNAIGIIGSSWVSNRDDTTCMSFLNKIKVVALSKELIATKGNSYQPYQAYLALGYYPLLRSVYIIKSEPRVDGLAAGFTQFLSNDRGQRIILKSGIYPATQTVRIVETRKDL